MLFLAAMQGVFGNHTDTQTTSNSLFDGFIAAEFHADVGLKLEFFEESVGGHAGAGTLLSKNEPLLPQCAKRDDFLFGQ